MSHVLDDNTQELTTLHNKYPIWESLDSAQIGSGHRDQQFAAELVAASLHIFPPAVLKSTLVAYGISPKAAAARIELWKEAQTAVAEYGKLISERPVIIPDPDVVAAERTMLEAIENLLKPTKEKTNGRNKSEKEKLPSA
jgi:hypothetical protein